MVPAAAFGPLGVVKSHFLSKGTAVSALCEDAKCLEYAGE
jgi:hypothetical protein